jgi:hypothetical protein
MFSVDAAAVRVGDPGLADESIKGLFNIPELRHCSKNQGTQWAPLILAEM